MKLFFILLTAFLSATAIAGDLFDSEAANRERNPAPSFVGSIVTSILSFDQQNASYTFYSGLTTTGSSSFDWTVSSGNLGSIAYATGRVHGCACFAPSDPYISTASKFGFGGDYTICFWMSCTGTPEDGLTLFQDGDNPGTDGMCILFAYGGRDTTFNVYHERDLFRGRAPVIVTGEWVHYAFTYEGATGSFAIYMGGTRAESSTLANPSNPATNKAYIRSNSSSTFSVCLDNFEIYEGVILSDTALKHKAFLE